MAESREDQVSLGDIPDELILNISSYLDADIIIHSLLRVNKRLNDIFNDQKYWKKRIIDRWEVNYPQVQIERDSNWKFICEYLEGNERYKHRYHGPDGTQNIANYLEDCCRIKARRAKERKITSSCY